MTRPTPQDLDTLKAVASRLGIKPEWLEAVINFETAGTWDPAIKNPNSSARGLIQFIDATAKDLGYASALDLVQKHPTIESQLKGPVLKYFLRQGGKFATKQELWFAVFLPRYKKAPLDAVIFADDLAKQATFRRANPGIRTVGDYYHKLEKAFAKYEKAKLNLGTVVVTLALGAFFLRFFIK